MAHLMYKMLHHTYKLPHPMYIIWKALKIMLYEIYNNLKSEQRRPLIKYNHKRISISK